MGYLYILKSLSADRFYIGSTVDISTRLFRHNAGHHPSTKGYRPWKLVYSECFETLVEARRRERAIKAWKNHDYMIKMLKLSLD